MNVIPGNLRIDKRKTIWNLENPRPLFSWQLPYGMQTEYKINLNRMSCAALLREKTKNSTHSGSSEELCTEVCWDSGWVKSTDQLNAAYTGPTLLPQSIYTWKVACRYSSGEESVFSEPHVFATGLCRKWEAKFIWAEKSRYALFRKEWKLPALPILRAILHICSLPDDRLLTGYHIFINTALVGIGPGRSAAGTRKGTENAIMTGHLSGPDHILYESYDVSSLINNQSTNVISARCSAKVQKIFSCIVTVYFENGEAMQICSDDTWQVFNADAWYNPGKTAGLTWENGNSVYFDQPREDINSCNEPRGWQEPDFTGSWLSPVEVPCSSVPIAKTTDPITFEKIKPAILTICNDRIVFDFGKEIMACLQIRVKKNVTVHVHLGEEITASGNVLSEMRTGNTYEDTWILAGGTGAIHHEYREFRYGELRGEALPAAGIEIEALVVRYPYHDEESYFHCSDPDLKSIYDLCQYTIKATTLDLYTDSNTRERGAYEGDALINALAHYPVQPEYSIQRFTFDYLLNRPTWPSDWRLCMPLILWEDYQQTADLNWLRDRFDATRQLTYESCINSIGLLEKDPEPKKSGTNISYWDYDLVDWPQNCRDGFIFSRINTVLNAYQYKTLRVFAEMSNVLGCVTDAERYTELADRLYTSFNKFLFDGEKYLDGKGVTHSSLHANVYALFFGIVPLERKKGVIKYIKTKGMACGVYTSYFLLSALYEACEADYAWSLLTSRKVNSWLHMIDDLNCTMTAEVWDPSQKPNMTFSHPWAAGPLPVISRNIMGLSPLEAGYRKIRICPQPGPLLNAEIKVPLLAGQITIRFDIDKAIMNVQYSVPGNVEVYASAPPGWEEISMKQKSNIVGNTCTRRYKKKSV